jgi:hypothetical protein
MVLSVRVKCRFFALLFAFFLIAYAPFVSLFAAESTQAESIRRSVEQETLQNAMSAFTARDYMSAKIGFEMLSESAQDPETACQALFGLASVKLVLAKTPEEYQDAVSVWKKWSAQVDSFEKCADPRMITPFLLRFQPPFCGPASGLSDGGRPFQAAAKGRKTAKEAESKGVGPAKEMETLRAKLELREREIRRLRHQLESLEEIHRKYQEKKQEAAP